MSRVNYILVALLLLSICFFSASFFIFQDDVSYYCLLSVVILGGSVWIIYILKEIKKDRDVITELNKPDEVVIPKSSTIQFLEQQD